MKEALFYKKLKNKIVQCQLCPRKCIIGNGNFGDCGTRLNKDGKLYSVVYGKPCSANPDNIEKKPFYNFLPGTMAYSIATPGCNLHCKHCQNWEISQAKPEEISSLNLPSKAVVENAIFNDCESIAYTYTEPVVFYQYVLDIAKIAKKKGLKNVIVSNGFINPEPLKKLCKYIDGANIDLKSISDNFYKKVCDACVKPVLESLKILKKQGVWIEITNLIIPTLNDSKADIKGLILWLRDELGRDVPIHFTAFYPCYRLLDLPPTKIETLRKARKMALDAGMNYVYIGNLMDEEGSSTYCPKCKKAVITRRGFSVLENKLKNGKCPCGEKIQGVWK